ARRPQRPARAGLRRRVGDPAADPARRSGRPRERGSGRTGQLPDRPRLVHVLRARRTRCGPRRRPRRHGDNMNTAVIVVDGVTPALLTGLAWLMPSLISRTLPFGVRTPAERADAPVIAEQRGRYRWRV